MRRVKVLHVVTQASASGAYGGPYDTARTQAALLRTHGLHATLFACAKVGDVPRLNRDEDAVIVPVRHFFDHPALLFSLRTALECLKQIKRFDVIHISLAREALPIFALVAARLMGKKLLLQTHGMLTVGKRAKSRLDRLWTWLVPRDATMVALTPTEEAQLRSKGFRNPIRIAGNMPLQKGAVESRTITSSQSGIDVLFLSRLHPRKNVLHFIEAARVFSESGRSERFVVIGPDGGQLEDVLNATTVLDNFEYRGAVSAESVPGILASARYFVLPASDEPWSNVLVSSIHEGTPVIVSASAALAPLIEQAHAGLVFDDDNVSALVDCLIRAFDDPAVHEDLIQGCGVLANSNLSSKALGEAFIHVVRDIVLA